MGEERADAGDVRHTNNEETERVRVIYDRVANRYDWLTAFSERLFFKDGRRWVCSQTRGEVLEIAIGTGLNLPHYPEDVRLTGVDVSPVMLEFARRRAAKLGREVDLRVGDAQSLELPDESFDTVVSTLSLCTIPDDRRAVAEAHRVLRPGGRFIVLEHVRSHVRWVRAVQRGFEPLAVRFQGDHLLRDPLVHLEVEGFEVTRSERFKLGVVERVSAYKPQSKPTRADRIQHPIQSSIGGHEERGAGCGGDRGDDGPAPISVRPLRPADLAAAARLHASAFPHRLMSSFGNAFITRYYQAFAASPHATALVAADGRTGRVVGVLAGSFNAGAHDSYLSRKHGWALGALLLVRAVRHPVLTRRLLEAGLPQRRAHAAASSLLSRAPGSGGGDGEIRARAVGVLVYLAVAPRHHGRGAGAALVRAYEREALGRGVKRLELTTRSGEGGVGAFYARLGWRRELERAGRRTGLRMELYSRSLHGSGSDHRP